MSFPQMTAFCFKRKENHWTDRASKTAHLKGDGFRLDVENAALWLGQEDVKHIWLDVGLVVQLLIIERRIEGGAVNNTRFN